MNPFLKNCPHCGGQEGCHKCNYQGRVLDARTFCFEQYSEQSYDVNDSPFAIINASMSTFTDLSENYTEFYKIRVLDGVSATVEQVTELLGFLGYRSSPSCSHEHDCCGCVSSSISLYHKSEKTFLFRQSFVRNI
jgi:hypothetical protein